MAKVETTLTLEQLDAALELNGKLRAFDAGYAKGFAAGLEEAAKIVGDASKPYIVNTSTGAVIFRSCTESLATALRERAREEKSGKTIKREGK